MSIQATGRLGVKLFLSSFSQAQIRPSGPFLRFRAHKPDKPGAKRAESIRSCDDHGENCRWGGGRAVIMEEGGSGAGAEGRGAGEFGQDPVGILDPGAQQRPAVPGVDQVLDAEAFCRPER